MGMNHIIFQSRQAYLPQRSLKISGEKKSKIIYVWVFCIKDAFKIGLLHPNYLPPVWTLVVCWHLYYICLFSSNFLYFFELFYLEYDGCGKYLFPPLFLYHAILISLQILYCLSNLCPCSLKALNRRLIWKNREKEVWFNFSLKRFVQYWVCFSLASWFYSFCSAGQWK